VKINALVLFILVSVNVFGQDSTNIIRALGKTWRFETIGFSTSLNIDKYYNEQYTFEDLKSDTKNSSDFIHFNQTQFNEFNNFSRRSNIYQFNFSFLPYSAKKGKFNKQHELRLSLAYYQGIDNYIYFSNKFHRQSYGQPTPDTSYVFSVTYDQLIDFIGLETSYLVRSKVFWRRFNIFGGIGAGINYTLFSEVKESIDNYSIQNVSITTGSGVYYYDVSQDSYTYNYYKHNSALLIRGSGYYGLDIKMLEDLNLFFEGRTGFAYQKFLEGKSRARTFHTIGIGLRFKV
jgi:hypothetical protein